MTKQTKLILVAQEKGGAGKSVLTFLLAELYPEAGVLDLDDATQTTISQLKFREPLPISFLSEGNQIDRGKFNDFLEEVSAAKRDMFIGDMGASISEQLPYYLNDVKRFLPDILEELKIDLNLFVVIGGSNLFSQTMSYLSKVQNASEGCFTITLVKNNFYKFEASQEEVVRAYVAEHNLRVVNFNLSSDPSDATQIRLREVLKSGTGLKGANFISRQYFKDAIKTIEAQL